MMQTRGLTQDELKELQVLDICVGLKRAVHLYECDYDPNDRLCRLCGLDQGMVANAKRLYRRWMDGGEALGILPNERDVADGLKVEQISEALDIVLSVLSEAYDGDGRRGWCLVQNWSNCGHGCRTCPHPSPTLKFKANNGGWRGIYLRKDKASKLDALGITSAKHIRRLTKDLPHTVLRSLFCTRQTDVESTERGRRGET